MSALVGATEKDKFVDNRVPSRRIIPSIAEFPKLLQSELND